MMTTEAGTIFDTGNPLNLARPQCGRCGKPVDAVGATTIADPNDLRSIVGKRLTYVCHGETKSFDVAAWWFTDPANAGKPFVPKVFEPIPPVVKPAADELEQLRAENQRLTAENEQLRAELQALKPREAE